MLVAWWVVGATAKHQRLLERDRFLKTAAGNVTTSTATAIGAMQSGGLTEMQAASRGVILAVARLDIEIGNDWPLFRAWLKDAGQVADQLGRFRRRRRDEGTALASDLGTFGGLVAAWAREGFPDRAMN